MVGGGTTGEGATFARLAAKIPARRIPDVVERLIALYTREKRSRTSRRPPSSPASSSPASRASSSI